MTNSEKKELACKIYLQVNDITHDQLAELVGVNRNTIQKWKDAGDWAEKKTKYVTSDNLILDLQLELVAINEYIKAKPETKWADSKTADARLKIVRTIESLRNGLNSELTTDCLMQFTSYIQKLDKATAEIVLKYATKFIQNKIEEEASNK